MYSRLFKTIQLSPYFAYKAAAGVSFLYDIYRDGLKGKDEKDYTDIRLIFAFRSIVPAVSTMKLNYLGYQRAAQLLSKSGYRKRWANFFLDTTCGRKQLKTACREQGHLSEYLKHIKEEGVRWYHIDPQKSLRFFFPLDAAFITTAAYVSHQSIKNG